MARVWFARRRGGQWIAPGGRPAYERPLSALIFPLDLAPHRLLVDDFPVSAPELPGEDLAALEKVIVEIDAGDLRAEFSGYSVGYYDSPYSPREAVRRLGPR
jgi:hypothetical protein